MTQHAIRRIPITKPVLGEEELEALREPLMTGWLVQGPKVKAFEDRFSEYVGSRHAVATSSCTTALHAAVAALGLGRGDEVIVPAFTWVATPNVVEYQGARPVFVDIDLRTYNLDPTQLESLVTERTVGIIPVHLFGLCADMDPILDVARRHHLWVVEDAACGFGASYRGRPAGTVGDAGCFSFHPRKSITTGEGGMLTTDSERLAEQVRSLRDHGASRSDLERHTGRAGYLLPDYDVLGFNYRMTDLQAAVGVVQMGRAPWILERRRALAAGYDQLLESLPWLERPVVPDGYVHGYQAYVCLFRPEPLDLARVHRLNASRNEIMDRLEAQGIACRQGTHAPVLQGLYRDRYSIVPEEYPNAVLADRLSLALPLYPEMTESDQEHIVAVLRQAFEG
jgi:dTDP-4-amino-4,6-dideoxygalactose transaminase